VSTRRGGMEKTSKGKRGLLLCAFAWGYVLLLGGKNPLYPPALLYSAGVLLYRARLNGFIITYRSLIPSHPEKSCPIAFGTSRNLEFLNLCMWT
jgi:hypothetical protein